MMTLFKSLVLSRLDYGSQLWSPTKIHQIIIIENIQKAFTKHIKGFSPFSYQERLSNLKIYSVQRRRERYIIIYVWKILENLVPNLVKPLQFYVSDRRGCLCSVSYIRLGHTGTLAYSSFRWKGIRLFNSFWSPKMKKHQDSIEKVQRRATRLLPEISHLPYTDRLFINPWSALFKVQAGKN